MRHPTQTIVDGRFVKNRIVEHLLEMSPHDMNQLACIGFDAEDWTQFAQLIGYSLDGFGTLSYVTDEAFAAAQESRDLKQQLADREADVERLQLAIRWALGENAPGAGDFTAGYEEELTRREIDPQSRPRIFWWRSTLRRLAEPDEPLNQLADSIAADKQWADTLLDAVVAAGPPTEPDEAPPYVMPIDTYPGESLVIPAAPSATPHRHTPKEG